MTSLASGDQFYGKKQNRISKDCFSVGIKLYGKIAQISTEISSWKPYEAYCNES